MTDGQGDRSRGAITLPSYDELRARTDGAPPGTAWGVFGDQDEVGTINLLDASQVLAGVREVRLGDVYPRNWDVDQPAPHPYRRKPERTKLGVGSPPNGLAVR